MPTIGETMTADRQASRLLSSVLVSLEVSIVWKVLEPSELLLQLLLLSISAFEHHIRSLKQVDELVH